MSQFLLFKVLNGPQRCVTMQRKVIIEYGINLIFLVSFSGNKDSLNTYVLSCLQWCTKVWCIHTWRIHLHNMGYPVCSVGRSWVLEEVCVDISVTSTVFLLVCSGVTFVLEATARRTALTNIATPITRPIV